MSASIPDEQAARQLAALALRLRSDAAFMASAMAAYQADEHASDSALASYLRLETAQLSRLALCRRPDPASPDFGEQVRQIATFSGADLMALAALLRRVSALGTLRGLAGRATSAEADPMIARGLLAAARDREPNEGDEPDASNKPDDEESP